MYFNDILLLQNTLLPYFCNEYPLISLNKGFSKLNYEKYNTHIQPHGIVNTHDPEDKTPVRYNCRNGNFHGVFESWHDTEGSNGQLHIRKNYFNDKLNGLYETWYNNGRLHEKCNYKNDELDGLCEDWYNNGQIEQKCYLINNKFNGLFQKWYETEGSNCQIRIQCNYKDDLLDGEYEEYDRKGNPIKIIIFKDGEVQTQIM